MCWLGGPPQGEEVLGHGGFKAARTSNPEKDFVHHPSKTCEALIVVGQPGVRRTRDLETFAIERIHAESPIHAEQMVIWLLHQHLEALYITQEAMSLKTGRVVAGTRCSVHGRSVYLALLKCPLLLQWPGMLDCTAQVLCSDHSS